jgi:uncharacterized membrane protein YfcA
VQIYLPIAEIPVDMFLVLGMGIAVGFISGMFGIGGGFLMTPLLIFIGIPPAVAVATQAAQITASSTSSAFAYWRRRALDEKLALILIFSGIFGTVIGVWTFNALRRAGQLDLFITLSYVTLMSLIGSFMLVESLRAVSRTRRGRSALKRKPGNHGWYQKLPWRMRFPRSGIYVSVIPLFCLGAFIGFCGSILGIGGGFMIIPALIYLFRVPTSMVVGVSVLQLLFTMLATTILHALTNGSVDIVLALLLICGSVIGAQFGARTGQTLKAEQFRLLLALLVLAVGLRFAADLVGTPDETFSIRVLEQR